MNALSLSLPEPAGLPLHAVLPQQRLRLVSPPHDVSVTVLDRFATGNASQKEQHAVVRHLLAGCPQCRMRLQGHWGIGLAPAEGAYDQAIDRSLDRSLERCQASIPAR